MSFKSFFKAIGSLFTKIFGNKKQIEEGIKKLSALAKQALPIIELVAKATPTQADDLVIAAAKNLGYSIKQIYESTDDLIKDGGRQRIAGEALKLKLIELVQKEGKVKVDDFTLSTVADVLNLDKTTLLTAVQAAFFFFKGTKK